MGGAGQRQPALWGRGSRRAGSCFPQPEQWQACPLHFGEGLEGPPPPFPPSGKPGSGEAKAARKEPSTGAPRPAQSILSGCPLLTANADSPDIEYFALVLSPLQKRSRLVFLLAQFSRSKRKPFWRPSEIFVHSLPPSRAQRPPLRT